MLRLSFTVNMTDKERGQNIQFLILPSTIAVVDKRTSLHCYYHVKMCRTGEYACDTCSTHFYIIAGKGCSIVYLRNCIFCPLSLSVMFIVIIPSVFISFFQMSFNILILFSMKQMRYLYLMYVAKFYLYEQNIS